MQEDNWLRYNYTKENLMVEQHTGYGVVYQTSTGKPMVMGGVFNDGRYPKNVAKQINRLYTFPEFRMKHTDMTDGFRVTCSLIDALEKVNNYEVYLITMQNRQRGGKRWWDGRKARVPPGRHAGALPAHRWGLARPRDIRAVRRRGPRGAPRPLAQLAGGTPNLSDTPRVRA